MNVKELYETRVRSLNSTEQMELMALIARGLAEHPQLAPNLRWRDAEGMAPDLLNGEDAQAWVSRTRRESDEHREATLRKGQ